VKGENSEVPLTIDLDKLGKPNQDTVLKWMREDPKKAGEYAKQQMSGAPKAVQVARKSRRGDLMDDDSEKEEF
jgi:hypothetical protein